MHNSQMALALLDTIPPVMQPAGRLRKRLDFILADRAYYAEGKIRHPLRQRHICLLIA